MKNSSVIIIATSMQGKWAIYSSSTLGKSLKLLKNLLYAES